MPAHGTGRSLGPPSFFFNLTLAAMILVVVARHALVFLVAWELMTLASFMLVSFDHDDGAVRRAGWVYLIASHVGVALLVALFLALGRHAGDLDFAAFAMGPRGGPAAGLVLALATLGFGVKAGFVPLHVWLPEAHAAAPSHVSAFMSGVLIKMGLYGLLRVLTFLPRTAWWGPTFIAIGLAGGFVGISLALYQRDIKRILAYSSIENVGLVMVGLGVGLWGAAHGHPQVAGLGIAAALLHLWNHAVMKGLLFLAAGSAVHGAGSRDIERMGGLHRRMPVTGTLLVLGAVAIVGLPPLCGFASEWLLTLGLVSGGLASGSASGLLLLATAAAVATVGVLAALCFVRLVGVALLGQPRSPQARAAHESGRIVRATMLILGLGAAAMALTAPHIVPLLAAAAAQILGAPVDLGEASASLARVAKASAVIWLALLASGVALRRLLARQPADDDTWACGYVAPTARMQYTGRSFAELWAERLLPPPLRLRVLARGPSAIFAGASSLSADSTDPVTRSFYEPFFDRWAARFARLRWVQQGVLHVYLLYILAAVVLALVWASARRWWG